MGVLHTKASHKPLLRAITFLLSYSSRLVGGQGRWAKRWQTQKATSEDIMAIRLGMNYANWIIPACY